MKVWFLEDSNGLVGLIFNHEKYHFLLELLSFTDRRVTRNNNPDDTKASHGLYHLEKAGLSKPYTLEHLSTMCGSPSVFPVL